MTLKETVTADHVMEFRDIGIMYTDKLYIVDALEDRRSKNINPFKGEEAIEF